jgi:hypothetical protein
MPVGHDCGTRPQRLCVDLAAPLFGQQSDEAKRCYAFSPPACQGPFARLHYVLGARIARELHHHPWSVVVPGWCTRGESSRPVWPGSICTTRPPASPLCVPYRPYVRHACSHGPGLPRTPRQRLSPPAVFIVRGATGASLLLPDKCAFFPLSNICNILHVFKSLFYQIYSL